MRNAAGIIVARRRVLGWCGAGAAITLAPAWAAATEAVPAASEPRHHVIFDNPDLRIMRVLIPPGASSGWHLHAYDFVITVLRGTKIRTEIEGEGAETGEMVTGSVIFAPYEGRATVHRVTNTSTWLNHQLTFEILAPRPGGYGGADRGTAPEYEMILDNPRVRAWRLRLPPGAYAAPVVQSGPGVRVMISGGRVIDTPAKGTATETDVAAGDAAFLAPETRSVANGGNGPLEMIEFEVR